MTATRQAGPSTVTHDTVEPNGALARVSRSPLEIFDRLADVPGQDIEKLSRLLDMQREWAAEQARIAAFAAKNRVEDKMPDVIKDAMNTYTGKAYARLETVHRAIKPIYTAEGFSITFTEDDTTKEGHMRIHAELQHASGWSKVYRLDLPIDGSGAKGKENAMNAVQARGSTVSYGRRYLECMIFNITIAGEDTDGNSPLEPIGRAQVEALTERIKQITDLGAAFDEAAFMKYLEAARGIKLETLADLDLKGFEVAWKALGQKLAQAKKQGAK